MQCSTRHYKSYSDPKTRTCLCVRVSPYIRERACVHVVHEDSTPSSVCTQPRWVDVGAHTCSCTPTHPLTHPPKHTHPSGPILKPARCGTLQHYFVVARYCWRGYSSRKAIFPPLIEKYSLIDLIIK